MKTMLNTGKWASACARRPWLTLAVWVLVLALAIASMSLLLKDALTTEYEFTRPPESEQGRQLIEERMGHPQQVNEVVIITSDSLTVDDPAFRRQVESLAASLNALGGEVVESSINYYQAGDQSLVSSDRHTMIMPVVMAGDLAAAEKNIDRVISVAENAGKGDGLDVLVTGAASSNRDFNQLAASDLQKAEIFGIPIALVILVVVFGTLVAAGLPLLLAGFAIVVAIGVTALVGQGFTMNFFVVNMITMMGLAVGIDYSLFVISRYREELARGLSSHEAIAVAGGTASRAVLFSGMTVILALAGMLILPLSLFISLAAGAIFVVAAAVLAALTLLPALLALIGGRINALRIPLAGRETGTGGRFWDTVTRTVMRRPLISAILAVAILVAPALSYFEIRTGSTGIEALPTEYQARQGYDILERQFSFGLVSPVEVVVDGDIDSPAVQQALARLPELVAADDAFYGAGQMDVNAGGDLAVVSLPLNSIPTSDKAAAAVERLRQEYVPEAFAGTDARVMVSGEPAIMHDYHGITDDYRLAVFAFVLGLSFILLMMVFRSLVVPLKAIIMNLLSVGAAYGLLVLVFQEGVGASLFGFQQVEVIETWVPLFLFSVLFGLSMDYHVFLLGRIRESYLKTGDNSGSVAFGLRSTGRLITGAALIMVAVFGGFAAGDLVMFQQMGFGLAVAVLLDATIVRSVLVPATMKLLGEWNWYLPGWLNWLPEIQVEDGRELKEGSQAAVARPLPDDS